MNTIEFLRIPSMMVPDKECVVFEGKRFTYTDVVDRVNRLASALAEQGVKKGDRVGVLQTNCNQYVEAYYATSLLGGVFVPLNFRAKRTELAYMINDSETSTLFVGDQYIPLINDLRPELPLVQRFISIETRYPDMIYYEDLLEQGSPDGPEEPEVDDADLNILMYTSGTTSLPKGVMLTYGGFSEYVLNTSDPASEEGNEAVLLVAPLYHVAGASAIMTAIYSGKLLVIQRQFDALPWLEAVQNEKVTNAFVVPTMLKRIVDHPDFDKYDLSSLKMLSYGAAPMPIPVIRRAIEKFPKTCSYMNAFGQTETTSTVTLLGPEDHQLDGDEEEVRRKLIRLGSIGRPVDDVVLQILDEDGNVVPPGTIGEIAIMVSRAMTGYWKREKETASTLVDGWIRTRDMGWIDEDNYVFLAGRKSDMIIRGGENVAPEQIEGVLNNHAAIEECAIIGLPDEEWGEKIMAVVVLKPGAKATPEELTKYCKQYMASFKAPEVYDFVDELPRNSVGKLLKNVLREKYMQPAAV